MPRLDLRCRLTSIPSFEGGLRALLVLNLLDAFATLTWVYLGHASEANPLMAMAIDAGPAAFVLSKVALVCLAVALLWRHREVITARLALVPLALLYALVGGGHLGHAIQTGIEAAPQVLAMAY